MPLYGGFLRRDTGGTYSILGRGANSAYRPAVPRQRAAAPSAQHAQIADSTPPAAAPGSKNFAGGPSGYFRGKSRLPVRQAPPPPPCMVPRTVENKRRAAGSARGCEVLGAETRLYWFGQSKLSFAPSAESTFPRVCLKSPHCERCAIARSSGPGFGALSRPITGWAAHQRLRHWDCDADCCHGVRHRCACPACP